MLESGLAAFEKLPRARPVKNVPSTEGAVSAVKPAGFKARASRTFSGEGV
jgi:hypothetical protein